MMNKPKMILFDYGGTLLCEPDWDNLRGESAVFGHVVSNPDGHTPEALSAWEQGFIRSRWFLRDHGIELPLKYMLRLKYELHGIKLDIPYEEAEFLLWSNASLMTERCVYPHIPQVLDELHEKGIRTGVVSNLGWSGESLKKRIDTLLPNNRFEFVITSSDYGVRKPDTRLFRVALSKAELPPESVWYCGNDEVKDVGGATSAGMFAVHYLGHMEEDRKELPLEPTRLPGTAAIKDWLELPELIDGEAPLKKEGSKTGLL